MPRQAGVPLPISLTLGLTMLGAPSALLLVAGLHRVGSWAVLLYALLPLFTAFSVSRWSPAMVVPVGAMLVLLNGTVPLIWSKAVWAVPVLAAVGLQAFALRFAGRQLRNSSMRGLLFSMALQSIVAAALLALGSALFDPLPRLAWAVIRASLLPALLAAALPYALFYRLLAGGRIAPHQAATTQWLQFLVTVLEGTAAARVWPSWQSWAAILTVLVCTGIVLQPEDNSRPPYLFSPPS